MRDLLDATSLLSEKLKLFQIAIDMEKAGMPEIFIEDAVKTALEFEGVSDLMNLWVEEQDGLERDRIVDDIQAMIKICS